MRVSAVTIVAVAALVVVGTAEAQAPGGPTLELAGCRRA